MNINGMLPENTFENKVILITGGGTGLGKSMGKYIIELGGKLIITSRKQEVIEKTSNEFNKLFPDSTFRKEPPSSFRRVVLVSLGES